MLKLVFHPDTSVEIKSSYLWYQEQAKGLGDDFLYELESAYQAIASMPDTWPKFSDHSQRFLLSKFPFSVIFHKENSVIFVLAIMHNSRKPGYWSERKIS